MRQAAAVQKRALQIDESDRPDQDDADELFDAEVSVLLGVPDRAKSHQGKSYQGVLF
jgi:hypothetical protein